ncbi:MAG: EAL domain-containing protein [Rhodocyclaceae bacterium]|nr:EAL domain-containing protein [Rhodocyclaceae bacterium]
MNVPGDQVGLADLSQAELTLLLRLGERLVAELDLENVLALVAETACQVVQAETLVVPIIDADGQTFTYRAGSGKYASMILGQIFPIHEGACGWVLSNQRPLRFGEGGSFDLNSSARWEPGLASSLLVPLICRGTITGGLSAMGKRGGGAFTLRDQTLLTLFANQASIAIDNASLFQKMAAERKRLETTLRTASDGIHILDGDGLLIEANDAFLRMLGFDKTAIGRLHDSDWEVEDKLEIVRERSSALIATQGTAVFETRHKRSDGKIIDVEISACGIEIDRQRFLYGASRDISERKAAAEEIQELAFYDPLTRLPNRRLLLDRLQQALVSSARGERGGALLFIDLDNFKTLNDTLGHDIGDLLLQQVAQRLVTCVREGDTVARLGGDEFIVMLEGLSENPQQAASQAELVGEKIRATLNHSYLLAGRHHRSTQSIGVTLFGGERATVEDLLKRADLAMYQAKAAGRATLRFFDPKMQAAVTARAALEIDLHQGLLHGQFLIYYQAQVDGRGRVTGAEALVRWQHPRRGLVSPADFIPLAEETGLILAIGQRVLETACAQLVAWAARRETAHLTVAVNVSARQFRHADFVDQVLAVLDYSGASPERLKLELTESLLLEDVDDVIAKMAALKAKGVEFSLDDFGTGYSSLSYLKRLPLYQLKIDQSFVRDILTDPNDAAIARTIVALAQSMGLGVIAEGVETEKQREFLARIGCHACQGYLFSRPVPLPEFERFLAGEDTDAT